MCDRGKCQTYTASPAKMRRHLNAMQFSYSLHGCSVGELVNPSFGGIQPSQRTAVSTQTAHLNRNTLPSLWRT